MSSSTNSTAAWQAYQAGDLPRAEQLARQLLRNEPANARAVCLLGAVCHARGRRAEALDHYRRAVWECGTQN